MREVLSVSLKTQTTEEIKRKSKSRGFSSVSGYINFLVEQDSDLIDEDEILKRSKKVSCKYRQNKLHKLKNISDLLK